MRKTLIIITAVIACIIVAIAGLILAYTRSSDYTADHLPQKTSIALILLMMKLSVSSLMSGIRKL